MKMPNIVCATEVIRSAEENAAKPPGFDHYVPGRTLAGHWRWQRIKAAWLVYTGRADAVTYPKQ
jgi:hypothetical protein